MTPTTPLKPSEAPDGWRRLASRARAVEMMDNMARFLTSQDNPWNALSAVDPEVIEEQIECIRQGEYPGKLAEVRITPVRVKDGSHET